MTCASPLTTEALLAWWLGELPAAAQDTLEEHLLACAPCAGRGEALAALAHGVRAAMRAGAVGLMVSAPFVERMKQGGLRLREYRVSPGTTVDCTLRADEDVVVGRMRAPLADISRLDAVHQLRAGRVEVPEVRVEDIPFDAAAGEVLFVPAPAWLRKMPAHTMRVRLLAVGVAGETSLGEYTFAHTP